MGEHLFVICGLHELIVHHNKGVYSLRSSLHQQTTPRQQLPFLLCDSIISCIGRPDNENHYADDQPNIHYMKMNNSNKNEEKNFYKFPGIPAAI